MQEQAVEDGAVLVTENGIELRCIGVRYEENPETQERYHHEYIFRAQADLDAEAAVKEQARLEAEKAEADAKAAQEAHDKELQDAADADPNNNQSNNEGVQ